MLRAGRSEPAVLPRALTQPPGLTAVQALLAALAGIARGARPGEGLGQLPVLDPGRLVEAAVVDQLGLVEQDRLPVVRAVAEVGGLQRGLLGGEVLDVVDGIRLTGAALAAL